MKILVNLIIALSLLAVLSCQKDQATNQSEDFSLNSILSDSNWVEVTDTLIPDLGCHYFKGIKVGSSIYDTLFIINNFDELNNVIDNIGHTDCKTNNLPNIDFKTNTLLCYLISEKPHTTEKQLFENNKESQYKYIIKVHITKNYKIGYSSVNWLLMPKIENTYNINTEVIKK